MRPVPQQPRHLWKWATGLAAAAGILYFGGTTVMDAIRVQSALNSPAAEDQNLDVNGQGQIGQLAIDGETSSSADAEWANAGNDVNGGDASAAYEQGPAGYRSLLARFISSGLMIEYGPEFSRLLAGEALLINPSTDLETFLGQLEKCSTPDEVKAALAPFATALRDAFKNKDPNLLDIQRQLGVALLFAAEQVGESESLTADQQLDTLVKIGAVLGAGRTPQLSLALSDIALEYTQVGDSKANRRNVDMVLRGRLELTASMRDLEKFESTTQRWMETSRDQRDNSVGGRWRLYAQRLATFPTDQVDSQGGATWPGLADSTTMAIISMGTGWVKAPPGAPRAGYVAARDGFVSQLDEIIRARTARGDRMEEVNKLVNYRNKVAATRVR